ncbi:MAG: DUF1801 domain-containing protein [candidate division Zixibacteria bacterium]|nr:DUF1801 domain-containing protein [candidate division Zixibacteria bacterium]
MKSEAANVPDYIKEAPDNRKVALQKFRTWCRVILVDYEETMAFGMPSYKNNDVVEIAFASQKNHTCFYVLKHEVMLANKKLLEGLNHGKGCIRFANPDKIDFEIIKKLLAATVQSKSKAC